MANPRLPAKDAPEPSTLNLRRRPDLVSTLQRRTGRRVWVVKDPLSMTYHQLGEEEHFILGLLNGPASLEMLQSKFQTQFAPRQISSREIQGFIGVLFRKGLLVSVTMGQGETLLERYQSKRRAKFWSAASNPLAIRFRGLDPERILSAVYPHIRWMFSPWSLSISLLLIIAALLITVVRFGEFTAQLPDMRSYFTASNVLLIGFCLAAVKVTHEFGHAFTCKHFGGECHELGFMLLVFTPAMYCDVSDTWLLPSKWRRAAVAAAGIFVELTIASLCLFLWWFSQPGLFNSICFNTILICSVSTVLINGNPLLRYDGYFILSDLLEAPNLWQTSRDCLTGWLRRMCLGVETQNDALPGNLRPTWLITYAIASNIYRLVIVFGILLGLHTFLRPLGLGVFIKVLGFTVAAFLVGAPIYRFYRFIENPAIRARIQPQRLLVTMLCAGAGLVALIWLPLPYRVAAPAIVEPLEAQRLYAPSSGVLVWALEPGAEVKPDDVVARVEDWELQREVQRLEGERDRRAIRLQNLLAMRSDDTEANSTIPATREAHRDFQAQYELQLERLKQLSLSANLAGVLRAAPARVAAPEERDLPTWSGQLLDQSNRGAFVERGELIGLVATPNEFGAILYVEQGEVDFVAVGQDVRIDLDGLGLCYGEVESIAKVDVESAPPQLRDKLPIDVGVDGQLTPRETLYQVRVTLDGAQHQLVIGASGRGKVIVNSQSLGSRIWRAIRRTFSRQL